MVRKENIVEVEGLRGGKGSAEIHHILDKEELMGHGKMYARVVLRPHSSIGWHQHVGDTEPYLILKGEGVFIDNDRSETVVKPGDVCVINVGEWHSIENNTDQELELMALVINEGAK